MRGSVEAPKFSLLSVFLPINMALGASQPLIPLFVVKIGGSIADVGLVASAYSLSAIFASRFWGSVSDRAGKRRPFIILGFTSTSIILFSFFFVSVVWQLILLNAIMGFLTTAYIPSASMLIIENNPRREWASRISLYNFFTGLGFSMGIMVGALWLSFESLRTLFVALATISAVGVVMSTYMIKEPLVTIERHAISVITSEIVDNIRYFPTLMVNLPGLFNIYNWSKMIRSRLLRDLPYFYLSSAILFTAFGMFFTPLPTYYRSIGVSNSNVFLLLLIHGLTLTFASILVRRLSRKSEKLLLRSGLLVRIVAFLAFAVASATGFFAGRDWSIAIIMVLTGISWSFYWVPSLTFLSKIADQNRLGEAQGTLNAMIGLGNVLGSLFSGYLVTIMNYQLNFFSSVIMMIIGFGLIADLLS